MIISIIAAVDENWGIGLDNQIPWHLPADLATFKELTLGHHLVAGRRTFQSIGSALPGRQMIVLTRNMEFEAQDCHTAASLDEALTLALLTRVHEVFIIGGAEIYQEALPLAERLYLTRVHASLIVDTFFPVFDEKDWELIQEEPHPGDENNLIPHTYFLYSRVSNPTS